MDEFQDELDDDTITQAVDALRLMTKVIYYLDGKTVISQQMWDF